MLINQEKLIKFLQTPSHVETRGNERADVAPAESATVDYFSTSYPRLFSKSEKSVGNSTIKR